ncbi:hypothetical protein [Acinetobacter bereziniae]|uniref:hypothetical protein n=1 Tax=Acinetobacter bereziniae TaxID=106648 RepID=UPI000C2C189B|nr:hypothetical protein [Acinetobacter bereziniae]ATZ65456.1 hypothetical protein BSR55_20070 [Acinetobacter bereziniae]
MTSIKILDGDVSELSQQLIPFKNHNNFLFHLYYAIDRARNKISSTSKKISRLRKIEKIYEIANNQLGDDDRKVLLGFIADTLEDDISIRIVDIISENVRFKASHDGYHNGHVDINVQSWDLKHTWLGEAKLYSGLQYTEKGLKQLVEDYSKGSSNESGGVLIYIDSTQLGTQEIVEDWKGHLELISKDHTKRLSDLSVNLLDLEIENDEDDSEAFFSLHKHHRSKSSNKYIIRHFCIDLRDNSK